MNRITINGIDIVGGNSISIFNGNVVVDGKTISVDTTSNRLEIRVLEGTIGELKTDSSVVCGNITGSVESGSSVQCGSVGDNVSAGSSVQCGAVGGNVRAGSSVRCGNVMGNVSAGSSIKTS